MHLYDLYPSSHQSYSLPPTSLRMVLNNATGLCAPERAAIGFAFYSNSPVLSFFNDIAMTIPLRPQTVQLLSRAATDYLRIASTAPYSRSINLVRIPVTHTGTHMASHLPHTDNHPRRTRASASCAVRPLHGLHSGAITAGPFLTVLSN
jgi:hypothetical protein